MMKKKRKYDLISLIMVVITLTMLSIGALILAHFSSDFGSDLQDQANDILTNKTNANVSTDFIKNDSAPFADQYTFWFFIATFIGIILLGLYLEFEPSVMIIIFIVGAIVILLAWIGSSVHNDFATDIDLATTSQPFTNVLMGTPYFSIFILVCLILLIVIMYNRKRSESQ